MTATTLLGAERLIISGGFNIYPREIGLPPWEERRSGGRRTADAIRGEVP